MASNESPAGYPEGLRKLRVQGSVALSFIVDTLGRVDARNITDLLRSPGDAHAEGHQEFVVAARITARSHRYRPATVGGCRVPMLVRQQFTFNLSDDPDAGAPSASKRGIGDPPQWNGRTP